MTIPSWNELDPRTALTALATFGLVLALWSLGTMLWTRRRRQQQRLIKSRLDGDPSPQAGERTLRLWREGEDTTLIVPGLAKLSLPERFDRLRLDCGWSASAGQLMFGLGAVTLALFVVLFFTTQSVVTGLGGAAVVLVLAWWYASQRRSRRGVLFERQLVDGLELAARALRAGQPLLGSFQLISDEIPAPVGAMFAEICQRQSMGMSLREAVRRAALLSNNADMKLFSASLSIHIDSGGNLAEVVHGIAGVIRERMRLSRRFRILTAQTQMSKRVLIGMPIVMFALLQVVNKGYMEILFATSAGNVLLGIAASGLLLGWFVMNKMATLEA